MIASLMMYRRPELEEAHDRWWALIRAAMHARGLDSPATLSQDAEEYSVWRHPELVLSQTCGMPYRTWLHDNVALVGTPDYGLEGCPPGHYRSAIVVRADDARTELAAFRGARFAYNQTFSQSGYAAPYWHMTPLGFWFDRQLHTGQHLKSARAVAEGAADIAALDAVSWRLMQRHEPFAAHLRVLDWTAPTPGLPLITALTDKTDAIFEAVAQSIAQLDPADRALLGIEGLHKLSRADYLAVPNPPSPTGDAPPR